MAAIQRSAAEPLHLDFKSLDMSLTDGTSIPAPLASPPLSPLPIARPPTPGGGPLSSHPATPVNSSPYSPPPITKPHTPPRSLTGSPVPARERERIQRKPLSPTSANPQSTLPRRRDSTGVRKLLSLSSLRNSFSSTRSLSLQRSPTNIRQPTYTAEVTGGTKRRPSSPSIMSSLTTDSSSQTPYQVSIHGSSPGQQAPQLRKRKSGSWFRRKSAMFVLDGEEEGQGGNGMLRPLDEAASIQPQSRGQSRPEMAFSAPRRTPTPTLPDVSTLRGGRLTDGAFAEEDVFTSIGR